MFKKKPQIKPLAPIRSSDRRKTADSIISTYGLQIPVKDDASAEEKATATTEHTNLRNSLLPDNIQSARFTTTHGPDLKQVSGTVYVGNHPGEDQRVLWFKIEEQMYPSVYTLWRHPRLVPLLHTPSFVIQKIQGGADLMTPGIAGNPPFPDQAKKGAVVAIASTDNPSVPLAVGTCLIDVSALDSVQGAKGHAVQNMHWAGDELWDYSTASKPGRKAPDELPEWLAGEVNVADLAASTGNLKMDDDDEEEEEGGVPLDDGAATSAQQEKAGAQEEGKDNVTQEEVMAQAEIPRMTTKEIDDAFRNAFLYGVYHHMSTNTDQPKFGLDFPLTQSFVMSNLIQPFLPAHTPEQAKDLQIKNTSHKNIKKFIKSLDKEMLLKAKERNQHETTILDIDFDDRAIAEFKPYRLPKKETMAGTSLGRGEKATSSIDTADTSIGQKLTIQQYFRPHERLRPLFEAANTTQTFFTPSEIRDIVTTYIETENLISPNNKRLVKLNPLLANSVFDGTQPLDREVIAKGTVPRDALIDRVTSASSPQYLINRTGQATTENEKPKAGLPPKIRIVLETRGGNKTVTKVSGVEAYFIPPQPLADELRKVCAGSTSVEQLVGSSPRSPVMEIMVQGPQRDAVFKALERRGVRAAWIEVVDKTKKKK